MNTLPKSKSSAGQALLVAVLAIAVSLIVVLSIISRSITDVAVSNKEDESLRAFSAAEAGVEKALITGSGQGTTPLGNASFSSEVGVLQGTKAFVSPAKLLSGETMTVWFVSHNADGSVSSVCNGTYPCFAGTQMKVCWDQDAAIEVSVYYGPASDMKIYRAAIDPDTSRGNNFSPVTGGSCDIGSYSFTHQKVVTFPIAALAGLKFAKIRVLYNTVPVMLGIDSTDVQVFPSQGTTITSSGLAGESNRKISVSQSYNEPAAVFETGIYSGGGLIK